MPDRIVWTSPEQQVIDLTDSAAGYVVTADGTTGLRSPIYDIQADNYASVDGATVQAIRVQPRTPTLGLFIEAPDRQSFRLKARSLVRAMRPRAGLGTLTVTTEWGESRSLPCYCTGGLEGDAALGVQGAGTFWRMVLKFYAPDPWWLGEEQVIDVGLGGSSVFFPIPPVNLGASTVQGQFVLDLSDSDAPTFPVWTVTGPGSQLVLRNETSGREITVSTSLATGDTIVLDTRPDRQSVRRGDGTNLMGAVTSDPALWSLLDSVNVVTVSLAGSTSDSRIHGTFQPRYAGI